MCKIKNMKWLEINSVETTSLYSQGEIMLQAEQLTLTYQDGENVHQGRQVQASTLPLPAAAHAFHASAVFHGASPMDILGKRTICTGSSLPCG